MKLGSLEISQRCPRSYPLVLDENVEAGFTLIQQSNTLLVHFSGILIANTTGMEDRNR